MPRSCDECAFPYLPYFEKCAGCGRELRSRDEAGQAMQDWMRIPEPDRKRAEDEVRKKIEQMGVTRGVTSRTRQALDMIVGAVLLAAVIGFTTPAGRDEKGVLIFNVILGLIAGVGLVRWIHLYQGSLFVGLIGFVLAYTLIWTLGLFFTEKKLSYELIPLFLGIFAAPTVGILLSWRIGARYNRAGDS